MVKIDVDLYCILSRPPLNFFRLITSDNVENTWKVSDLNAFQLRKEKQNVILILFNFSAKS